MDFKRKLKILLWKHYLDTGFSLTNNLKYVIALFALYEVTALRNVKTTILLGVIWAVVSATIGWWFYHKEWYSAQLEIQNRINPFVQEVRKSLNNKAPSKIHGKRT